MRIQVILSALAALAHASDAAVKADESTYHIDPQTGHTVECDETGCQIVSTGTTPAKVDDHYKLAQAAVGPNEVVVCDDQGCYIEDAGKVVPHKVETVCDDNGCVLVPVSDDYLRSQGICYDCDANAAAVRQEHHIDEGASGSNDYSNVNFQDRLKMMCAEESKNGLTSAENKGAQSDWQPTQKKNRRRRPPPRDPSNYISTPTYGGSSGGSNGSSSSSYAGSDRDLSKGKFDEEVAKFNSKEDVFDQQTYEVRVDAEADLMIALEALKNEVTLFTDDLRHLNRRIQSVESKIDRNSAEADENNSQTIKTLQLIAEKGNLVHGLTDECRYSASAMEANRNALTLYCQQFAFAPEMNQACASILTCKDRQLAFRFVPSGKASSGDNNQSSHQEGY